VAVDLLAPQRPPSGARGPGVIPRSFRALSPRGTKEEFGRESGPNSEPDSGRAQVSGVGGFLSGGLPAPEDALQLVPEHFRHLPSRLLSHRGDIAT
jgi:hypothetical protein